MPQKHTPLSQDAALVVALAGTAMPFAHSAEDEAERWLRALRLHGQVGAALQALGVGEAPLMTSSAGGADGPVRLRSAPSVDEVPASWRLPEARRTTRSHARLLSPCSTFTAAYVDRVLYMRGTSRDEAGERCRAAAHAATAPGRLGRRRFPARVARA